MRVILLFFSLLFPVNANIYIKGGAGFSNTNGNSIIRLSEENKNLYTFLKEDKRDYKRNSFLFYTGGLGFQKEIKKTNFFISAEILTQLKPQKLENIFSDDGILERVGTEYQITIKNNTTLKIISGIGSYFLVGYNISPSFSVYIKNGLCLTSAKKIQKTTVLIDDTDKTYTAFSKQITFKNIETGLGFEHKVNDKFSVGAEFLKAFTVGNKKLPYDYGIFFVKYNF